MKRTTRVITAIAIVLATMLSIRPVKAEFEGLGLFAIVVGVPVTLVLYLAASALSSALTASLEDDGVRQVQKAERIERSRELKAVRKVKRAEKLEKTRELKELREAKRAEKRIMRKEHREAQKIKRAERLERARELKAAKKAERASKS